MPGGERLSHLLLAAGKTSCYDVIRVAVSVTIARALFKLLHKRSWRYVKLFRSSNLLHANLQTLNVPRTGFDVPSWRLMMAYTA